MSAPNERNDALKNFDALVQRAGTLVGKAIGSPVKKLKKSRGLGGPKRGRLTEREEDEILLEDEMHEEKSRVAPRLSKQLSNIKGGTMRDYQLAGLNWLVQLYHKNISGILADEMGLGKTMQSISFLAYLRLYQNVNGPHLIVVPLSTLGNWIKEINRWCPDIRVLKLHGSKDERLRIMREDFNVALFDVCVTSYEMVIKEKGRISKIDWHVLVVDEAHRLKNEKSLLSTVLRTFPTKMRILLTGTPLQNNLHELWALLNFLLPKMFESSESFDQLFDNEEEGTLDNELIRKLHKILRPFMLRRLKADVEKSLLPKIETLLFVGMSDLQLDVYRKVQTNNMDALQGAVKGKRKLLNIVMQLRKAANHPYLFDGVEDRSLPPFGDHLIKNSGKMVLLDKLLPRLKEQDSRVLIFSQMTRMIDILEDYCLARGYKYCRIDGTTDQESREEQMETFNAPNSEKFLFLLSTRAGGLGINLATADVVVLFDSDWNPQMDLQAMDRAHRIGQKKQVQVYRFICDSTIEERIIYRAELKLRLDAIVVQQGRLTSGTTKLGQNDMIEMIRYGADKIFRAKGGGIQDEDIDAILARGQEKTTQFNEKVKEHVGMKDPMSLSLPGTDDSNLISDHVDNDYNLAIVTTLHEAMGKRERKRNYNEDAYYREALAVGKTHKYKIPRPLKLPKLEDFQFFNSQRLKELNDKEWEFWELYQDGDEKPPTQSALTEEEKKEKEYLLSEGFLDWNKRHFFNYRTACAEFGRNNIEKICLNVAGKEPDDVRRYHKVFWKKYKTINDYEKQVIKHIERGEKKLAKKQELEKRLRSFIENNGGVEFVRENLHLKYSAQQRHSGFTFDEDRFLLLETYKVGYGSWDALRRSIFNSPDFLFDYYLKTRNSHDLNRRVDVLIRLVTNENNANGNSKKRSRKTPTPTTKKSTTTNTKKKKLK